MNLRRRPVRLRIALLALCMLLLSQSALVAHACPKIAQAAARIAQVQLAQELAASASAGCPFHAQIAAAQTASSDGGADAAGQPSPLCLKHCADETSASNGVVLGADAPPPARALRIERTDAEPLRVAIALPDQVGAAPPLIIQYCVSLT